MELSCDRLLLLSYRAFNFRVSEDGVDVWLMGLSMLNCFYYLVEVGLNRECGVIARKTYRFCCVFNSTRDFLGITSKLEN